ncbi:DUF5597 domain-containing protein [Sphingomonas sp. KR1UV-12]|uniref:DUF5597 domain-containing protein n=1 Tax=Sphingomonas aurea TaxID=3063994 RepID=A0ABT9EJG6_9SPHN|nr:DUF5597 domain-containing protein [Sphingomonas sp. KR1UV-12]MDP1026977.1 DUF5597 domain-containing protein [Sphingomonas sp. KR1UV-12]
MKRVALLAALLLGAPLPAMAEEMPRLEQHDGRYMMRVDGKPFLILAAQLHNSSAWPDVLPRAWPAAEALAPNTIEAPVYWEQFEPARGRFDTRNVDALIARARASGKRLILLWFGTWKNGQMHYVPTWMKADTATFPRMIDARGEPIDVMSPHAPANLEADRDAYLRLMRHLKEVDGDRHTVIAVQVENEPGAIGSIRDHGAAAERAFAGPVPAAIVAKLGRRPGDWRTVFGPDAEEAFGAWTTASYIEAIAAAGKAVNPLPVYVNTWLRYKDKKYPGIDYPSGGAVWTMFDLWRAASPSVDFIGTDIYTDDADEYARVLDRYARPDNPSWVSETGFDAKTAPYLFYVLARGGIGFSVFGIDDDPMTPAGEAAVAAHRANFTLLDPIRDIVAQAAFDRRLFAAAEAPGRAKQVLDLGEGWQAALAFGPPPWGDTPAILANSPKQSGRAFVVRLAANSWLVGGIDARVELKRVAADGSHGQLLRVEEGDYRAGEWHATRWLNGDETDYGFNFGAAPRLLKVTTGTY